MNWQIVAVFFSGLFSGGLAGAVFTWSMNRPFPTVVTYNIITTTLGADPTLKNLLPDLTIQIGSDEVPVIHTHTVDLTSPSGPQSDSLNVNIYFSSDMHFFGRPLAEAPSPAYQISCSDMPRGINCRLSSIKPGAGRYRVTMATDQKQPPNVDNADKGIKLIKAEAYVPATEMGRFGLYESVAFMMTIAFSILAARGMSALIKNKESEIARLVEDRDRLQAELLRLWVGTNKTDR